MTTCMSRIALPSCSGARVAGRRGTLVAGLRPVSGPGTGRRNGGVQVKALMTPPPDADKKRKFITREEEPDQYWASKGEKEGVNPIKDPVALVGLLAIFFPFIFLLIAVATGAIDTSVYRYRAEDELQTIGAHKRAMVGASRGIKAGPLPWW